MGEGRREDLNACAGSIDIEAATERWVLLPQRAAWWPAQCTLIASDLHLGRCESLRALGAPVPGATHVEQLQRLSFLLDALRPRRLAIIGDLIHAGAGLSAELVNDVARFRERYAHVEFILIAGNHDRHVHAVAEDWRLQLAGEVWRLGDVHFQHAPPEDDASVRAAFTWSGHVHPAVRIGGRGDSLKLPCFWIRPRVAVLPAFCLFTGGVCVQPGPQDRACVIADGRVIALEPGLRTRR